MAQTTHQKLAALKAQAEKLKDEIAALEAKAALEVNPDLVIADAVVQFEHGKGDTKKSLEGAIVGRKDPAAGEKGGSQVKIAVGAGFDAAIYTVYVAAVTKIVRNADGSVPSAVSAEAQAAAANTATN